MVRWFRLANNQYFGLFAPGLALFALQELPYLFMAFAPPAANPLMEMQDKSAVLNTLEKALGISCVVVMLFLVRGDAKWFSLATPAEKVFFALAMAALAAYFIGWVLYYNGCQSLPVILGLLVALPPVYYALIGLWRGNYALTALGGGFLIAHLFNVYNNLK